jgi:hypothetical protein
MLRDLSGGPGSDGSTAVKNNIRNDSNRRLILLETNTNPAMSLGDYARYNAIFVCSGNLICYLFLKN